MKKYPENLFMHLVADTNNILNRFQFNSISNDVFNVTLFKGDNTPEETTFLFYPFHIGFYFSLLEKAPLERYPNEYVFINGVIHYLFSLITHCKKSKLLLGNLDSILFLSFKWLDDYEPRSIFYSNSNVDLITCKYCLEQFSVDEESSKFSVKGDYLCSANCRDKYAREFITDSLFESYRMSTAYVGILYNHIYNKEFCMETFVGQESAIEYIRSSIKLIGEAFFKRIVRVESPMYNPNYRSYDYKESLAISKIRRSPILQEMLSKESAIYDSKKLVEEKFTDLYTLRKETRYPTYKKFKIRSESKS